MRTIVVAGLLLFAGCKEKDKDAAREIASNVKERTIQAKDKVVEVTGDLLDQAIEKGKAAKVELDKAYKSDHAYDLAVDDVGSAEAAAEQARIDKMPSVDIKGVRVAYEEDSNLSLKGKTFTKHFRASWKHGEKIIRVSFYTQETIDAVAFAALLAKLFPAVQMIIK